MVEFYYVYLGSCQKVRYYCLFSFQVHFNAYAIIRTSIENFCSMVILLPHSRLLALYYLLDIYVCSVRMAFVRWCYWLLCTLFFYRELNGVWLLSLSPSLSLPILMPISRSLCLSLSLIIIIIICSFQLWMMQKVNIINIKHERGWVQTFTRYLAYRTAHRAPHPRFNNKLILKTAVNSYI